MTRVFDDVPRCPYRTVLSTKGGGLRSVEMFAGAGGMALGVHRAGFEHLAVNELDPFACNTLRVNHPWEVLEADSRDVDWAVYAGDVDLLGAGAPCQPFSVAGRALGDGDNRNLFPEAIRAIHEIRPRAVLLENVKGLGRPAFTQYLRYILESLAVPHVRPKPSEPWERHRARVRKASKAGEQTYTVFGPHDIDAADLGVPQNRHRLFVVAFRFDVDHTFFAWPEPTHTRDSLVWDQLHGPYWDEHNLPRADPPAGNRKCSVALRARLTAEERPTSKRWRTVRDALDGLPAPGAPGVDQHEPTTTRATTYHGHTGNLLDWPGKTVKAGVHGVAGGEGILRLDNGTRRRMTVRETARLQTFPDDWHVDGSRSRALRQLGNAVPVIVAEALASSIRSVLEADAPDTIPRSA